MGSRRRLSIWTCLTITLCTSPAMSRSIRLELPTCRNALSKARISMLTGTLISRLYMTAGRRPLRLSSPRPPLPRFSAASFIVPPRRGAYEPRARPVGQLTSWRRPVSTAGTSAGVNLELPDAGVGGQVERGRDDRGDRDPRREVGARHGGPVGLGVDRSHGDDDGSVHSCAGQLGGQRPEVAAHCALGCGV